MICARGIRFAVFPALIVALLGATAAHAQELSLQGGVTRATAPSESTYAWGFSYLQALDDYNALSYSWINEGHVTDHHRDGFAVQYWRRAWLLDYRLALAAGVGLYNYFDTTASDEGKPYADAHGWALKQKARDPEMRQTKKNGNWHFGMKLHIGVDSRSGLAHSAMVTAANVHDKHAIPQLLHGQEQRV